MPASTPAFKIPKIAIVMARLIVSGQDRGVRPFLVPICDEKEMAQGVTSIRLPPRSGTSPLDFSITMFNHVQLPPSALLGISIDAPRDPLKAWWDENWRIPIGTAAVTGPVITSLQYAAYIGAHYSLRRTIVGKKEPVSIFTFRTQQWPVLQALAVALVMDNWFPMIVQDVLSSKLDPRIRHAMSVILKTTGCRWSQLCIREVAERCGAQGSVS